MLAAIHTWLWGIKHAWRNSFLPQIFSCSMLHSQSYICPHLCPSLLLSNCFHGYKVAACVTPPPARLHNKSVVFLCCYGSTLLELVNEASVLSGSTTCPVVSVLIIEKKKTIYGVSNLGVWLYIYLLIFDFLEPKKPKLFYFMQYFAVSWP